MVLSEFFFNFFIYIFFIYLFLFFRRQGFRMIIFDRQAGPFQNFNRSQVMVIGRSVSFSDPARPPGLRPQEHFCCQIFFFQLLKTSTPHPHPRPRLALLTLTSILVQ